jgi:hypothetical protein
MSWRNATRTAVSCVVSYQRKCDGFGKSHGFVPRRDLVEHARLDIQSYCTNNFSARFVSSTSGGRMNLQLSQLMEYKEVNGDCNVPYAFKDNPA